MHQEALLQRDLRNAQPQEKGGKFFQRQSHLFLNVFFVFASTKRCSSLYKNIQSLAFFGDRHCFDAIRILPQVLHILDLQKFFLLMFTAVPIYIVFYFSRQCHRCHNLIYCVFDSLLKFSEKVYDSLALLLVKMEMNPDPDRQALDADPAK